MPDFLVQKGNCITREARPEVSHSFTQLTFLLLSRSHAFTASCIHALIHSCTHALMHLHSIRMATSSCSGARRRGWPWLGHEDKHNIFHKKWTIFRFVCNKYVLQLKFEFSGKVLFSDGMYCTHRASFRKCEREVFSRHLCGSPRLPLRCVLCWSEIMRYTLCSKSSPPMHWTSNGYPYHIIFRANPRYCH